MKDRRDSAFLSWEGDESWLSIFRSKLPDFTLKFFGKPREQRKGTEGRHGDDLVLSKCSIE